VDFRQCVVPSTASSHPDGEAGKIPPRHQAVAADRVLRRFASEYGTACTSRHSPRCTCRGPHPRGCSARAALPFCRPSLLAVAAPVPGLHAAQMRRTGPRKVETSTTLREFPSSGSLPADPLLSVSCASNYVEDWYLGNPAYSVPPKSIGYNNATSARCSPPTKRTRLSGPH